MARAPSPDRQQKKGVLLVDDHPAVRLGLAQAIDASDDFRICGEADGYASGWARYQALRPDITVTDLSMQDGSGFDLIARIVSGDPAAAILVVSLHDEARSALRAMKSGARGYLLKTDAVESILTALREVSEGRRYLSTHFSRQPIFGAVETDVLGPLSAREREVFRIIAEGKTAGEIAAELKISAKTVESHRAHIMEKLGLRNAEAVRKFAEGWRVLEGIKALPPVPADALASGQNVGLPAVGQKTRRAAGGKA